MMQKQTGFAPVYDKDSRLLILGSFPSVKSREIEFYYGNKQNRFWEMLCGYFGEEIPLSVQGKRAFLKRHTIALWDLVVVCEIQGSADASVKNAEIANVDELVKNTKIERILLNGTLAYELFIANYKGDLPYAKMPSTSPANPRYQQGEWWNALNSVFLNTRK